MTSRLAWLLAAMLVALSQVASRQRASHTQAAAFADLVRAANATHAIEAGVSRGFVAAPATMRDAHRRIDPRLSEAAARVLASYPAPSPEAGLAHLALGETADAVRILTQVVEATSTPSATVVNDLGAAQLVRARETGEALDYARAYDTIERALEADAHLTEAQFNRGLALVALGLDETAARAWQDYAARDPRNAWAAREHDRLTQLVTRDARRPDADALGRLAASVSAAAWDDASQAVRAMPQVAREYLDDELLPAWAEAQRDGDDTRTTRLLEQSTRVAAELQARHGERAWADLTRLLSEADVSRRREIANALLDLKQVRSLIDQNRIEEAAIPLARVPHLEMCPPLAAAVSLWRLYIEWHRGHRDVVREGTTLEAQDAQRRGFLYLAARLLLLRASTLESQTRFEEARAGYRETGALFATLGEREYEATSHAFLSTHLALQGDVRGGWTELRTALEALRDIDSPRRRFVVLTHAVVLTTRFGLPHAALALQKLLVDEVNRWGDDGARVRQFVERARLQLDFGHRSEASRDLTDAESALARLSDASYRALYEEDLRVEQARLVALDDPVRGAQMLGETIATLTQTGRVFRVAELHLLRGRFWRRAGQNQQALDEWLLGIQRFEDERVEVRDERLRISHFARAWELYDEIIGMLIQRGETDRALSFAERAHARVLLDSLVPRQQVPQVPIDQTLARLPVGVIVLVYYQLPDRLLIWSLERSQRRFSVTPISSSRLRTLTSDQGTGRLRDVSTELSRLLLDPVRDRLATVQTLVVVPDGDIASVSFAMLPMPGSEQPLVRQLSTTLTPSLALLDIASRWPSRPVGGDAAMLKATFLADPTPPRAVSTLPRLPAARQEISRSASVYTRARTFTGDDATKARLLEALDAADVLHFAGHAIANSEYPSRSRLIVSGASQTSDDGEVRAEEISGHRPIRPQLVVLSACSTAIGASAFGEGLLSLARPFLAAGVPQVVGTMWDIDDRAGSALMPRFHHWYRQGLGAAEALRRSQLELMASEDPLARDPTTWAAFVLVGGLDRDVSARH